MQKTIQLFLMDGDATGRIKASLTNWTGLVYSLPRTHLEQSKRERKELHSTGVYFLLGKSEENNQDIIYIGQAGERENGKGLLGRIEEHERSKEFWNRAILVNIQQFFRRYRHHVSRTFIRLCFACRQ